MRRSWVVQLCALWWSYLFYQCRNKNLFFKIHVGGCRELFYIRDKEWLNLWPLYFLHKLAITVSNINDLFASISNIIAWFFNVRMMMNVMMSLIIFFRMSVDSYQSSSSMSYCCGVVVDKPVSWDYLYGLYASTMVTQWFSILPIIIYDQRPVDSLSSLEVVIWGMNSVVDMVTVPPGLSIVSHDIDILDVVSFT